MTDRIINTLAKLGIAVWRINDVAEETAELFFVKKQLDTRRAKDTRKYFVTVYRDSENDGIKLRGSTDALIIPSDTDADIEKKLSDAYYAAQFAMNPFYELPDPIKSVPIKKSGELAEAPLAESAGKMAVAIFASDVRSDAFVNSAEIFVTRKSTHIVSSTGTDVAFTNASVEGEVVVQCLAPEDVEMFIHYSYDECDTEAIKAKVSETLDFVRDRAVAEKALKSGNYDVILCGNHAATVLSYYTDRSHASMIYSKYSTWKPNDNVQGDGAVGEKLDMTLVSSDPFSPEGIRMNDLPLLSDGCLENIHGSNRFCRYLGIEPTGDYSKIRLENSGTASFEDMKKKPCLWVVSFSDFQMDEFSGHYGGEIRLAYLIDENGVKPVTGGSINGSLLDSQTDLQFSTDRFVSSSYEGPYAMKLKNVRVAGVI